MRKGYTLIEVLVTIAIFLLLSGSVTSLFVSSLTAQRKTLASQTLFDNTSYILEYMGRALRMAKKDTTGLCLGTGLEGYNYSTSSYGDADRITNIRFINHHFECQEFYLRNSTGQIYQRISSSSSSAGFGSELPLTPDDFLVLAPQSQFLVKGASQTDQLQPRITLFLDIEAKTPRPEMKARIKIQTTISQRDLDAQY
ncbi:hypothetical protein AMJ49_02470 [Parcubacteria bacterium DG_74_2]|nr:MAG: hypothetical protein AMJ49_02470 [Parcubacteria bacterium DG_74_2]